MGNSRSKDCLGILEEAASRNAPLSMSKPESIGREPMPRGRFLAPENDSIVVENLQVPGRRVDVQIGSTLEAFFQHEGRLYTFSTRVLEMDKPVRLNGDVLVRGMKVTAPSKVEAGNRRQIYRQSFALVSPPVGVSAWAIPRTVLTADQAEYLAELEQAESVRPRPEPDEIADPGRTEFLIERSGETTNQIRSAETVRTAIPRLELDQLGDLTRTPPHWSGEIADASEFGIGLTLHDVVYSRLKVFQPLAIRFTLPEIETPLRFLMEVRRVQPLKSGARLGGLLLVNARHQAELKASRDVASFAIQLQRERVRSKKAG